MGKTCFIDRLAKNLETSLQFFYLYIVNYALKIGVTHVYSLFQVTVHILTGLYLPKLTRTCLPSELGPGKNVSCIKA